MKKDWEVKKLGEVLSIERGGSPRPISRYITNSEDGLNWIKIADATASDKYIYKTKEKITREGLHKTRLVNIGDFILSNSMSFGRPYIMKTTGCIHDGWLVLRQNGTKIFDTEFLYYLLSSTYVFNQFNSLAAGSTVRNLNIALVSSVSVPIPPLPEQKRIVSILDRAFKAIDKAKANAEQNLKNAKELFESYLQGVFENKGDDWEEKTLSEIVIDTCSLSYGVVQPGNDFENGLPVIRPVDLKTKFVKKDNVKLMNPVNAEKYKRTTLQGDELLLCVRGDTGIVSLITEDFKGANVTRGIVPVSFNKNTISLQFGYYSFISTFVQKQIKDKTYGAALMQVNIRDVRQLLFIVPPIAEQKQIVKKLDALQAETKKLETIYQQKIDNLEELKKSVLQKAFNGQLTMDN